MFSKELIHELKYWISQWSVYFYTISFVLLGALIYAGSLGFFDPLPDGVVLQRWINSPASINYVILYFHKFIFILLPAIVGVSLFKDYKSNAHAIIYSFPLEKSTYLSGRLVASLLVVLAISIVVIITFMLTEQLDGLNPNLLGPFILKSYAQVFLVYVLPNWITLGLLTFAVVMSSRKIYVAYFVILMPILFQLISENALAGHPLLIAVLDPLGQNVATYYQKDWDIISQNTYLLPVDGLILLNRLLWIGLSSIYFFLAYFRFEFVESIDKMSFKKIKKQTSSIRSEDHKSTSLGKINIEFTLPLKFLILWRTTIKNLWDILSSTSFWILLGLGLLSVMFIILKVTTKGDFNMVLATQVIIGMPAIVYSMVIVLATFIFAGFLIQKESQFGMDQLLSAAPVAKSVFLIGKFFALVFMQLIMLAFFIFSGIFMQLYQGYFILDISLYFKTLYIHTLIPLITWALVAIFIHGLAKNLYVGIFILMLAWIGIQGYSTMGIESYLFRFNEIPRLVYSAINGFGPLEDSILIIGGYWFFFGVFLFIIAIILYDLAADSSIKDRWSTALSNFSFRYLVLLGIPLIPMLLFGMKIHRAETVNPLSMGSTENQFNAFKESFKEYRHLPQPRILSLIAELNVYPQLQKFECQGHYILINNSRNPIDTLLVKSGFDEITTMGLNRSFEVILKNDYMKTELWKLEETLLPNDSLIITFNIRSEPNTITSQNNNVFENGTFLGQDIFPRLGYHFDDQMPEPSDSLVGLRHYQSIDSDKVSIDIIIGTEKGQIALAPGDLINQWNIANRAFFRYKTKSPVKFTFGMHSGRYIETEIAFNTVDIDVFSIHQRMIPSMVEGVSAAIEFNEKHFSPYPYKCVRIIEFPLSSGTFATAYANNLVISEARFLAEVSKDTNMVDVAYYVAAHEITHHWWGNEVLPAYAKGATMLTESITEYLMLRLLEEYKGETIAQKFYELQKKRYESGKSSSIILEPSIVMVMPEQQYISYGKGAIALYDFSEKIGRERFYELLKGFMDSYVNKGIYPTSLDFVSYLQSELGPAYSSLIQNTFFNK